MLKSPGIICTQYRLPPVPYFLNPARQHENSHTHTHTSKPASQTTLGHAQTRILRHNPPRRPQPPKTHRHPVQKPLPLAALLPPVALGLLLHLRLAVHRAGRMQRRAPAAPDIAHESRGTAADGVAPSLAFAEDGGRSCCFPHGCKRDG